MHFFFPTNLYFFALKLAPANVKMMLSNIYSVPVAMKASNEELAAVRATKRQGGGKQSPRQTNRQKAMEVVEKLRGRSN